MGPAPGGNGVGVKKTHLRGRLAKNSGNAMKKGCHCGSLCHAKSMPSIKKNATQTGAAIRGRPLRVRKEKLGYVKKSQSFRYLANYDHIGKMLELENIR
jgi:hypothetical protein